ncbi:hypothetical protein AB0I28_07005 [Phytomonospora sp. NPDC050363]|uniref:hypothetical protein n=1 Tax=Phytomonospora sp. NPDC050363 TaxID=3155642 RepID=UPI0033E1596B
MALIMCTSVVLSDLRSGDGVELELAVGWTPEGTLAVDAGVGLPCFCATEHGTHYAESLTIPIPVPIPAGMALHPLPAAFAAATAQLAEWSGQSSSPSHWRALAGLPGPSLEPPR